MGAKKTEILFTAEQWLDELREAYDPGEAQPDEITAKQIEAALKMSRTRCQKMLRAELAAGRMTKRPARLPSGHLTVVYRRVGGRK